MGTLSFSSSIETVPLRKQGGLAAFDPVTLRLAAETCAGEVMSVRAPSGLEGACPESLRALAQVTVERDPRGWPKIVCTIDTGDMPWSVRHRPIESTFTTYAGDRIAAVEFASLRVAETEAGAVTKIPMRLPAGTLVDAWFLELDQELSEVDGLALQRLASGAMRGFSLIDAASETFLAEVHVPQLELEYRCDISGVLQFDAPSEVEQHFTAELDVQGARVRATTVVMVGAALHHSAPVAPPPVVRFGEHGPVLWWFAEQQADRASLPFALIYMESPVWTAASH